MAKKAKYDISNFRVNEKWGWLEYRYETGWHQAEYEQEEWYNKQKNKVRKEARITKRSTRLQNPGSRPRNTVPNKYRSYFPKDTKFTNRQGHTQGWAKNLTLSGGKEANQNWQRVKFYNDKGQISRTGFKEKWGANLNKGSNSILIETKGWVRQLQIAIYALELNAENFRVVVGRRALKVFQNSFKYQQFYSQPSHRWASLSAATLKKRARRGTGSKILVEYGDLRKSIKMKENVGAGITRIYTDVVPANPSHHKKHSICYAGYHNEGVGTYGSAWNGHKPKAYIQRQFMGHSSYLNPLTDDFMRKMMKLYLFDSVFLMKKA